MHNQWFKDEHRASAHIDVPLLQAAQKHTPLVDFLASPHGSSATATRLRTIRASWTGPAHDRLHRALAPGGGTVRLLNLHASAGGSAALMTELLCELMHAAGACQAMREGRSQAATAAQHDNPSTPARRMHTLDILAAAALHGKLRGVTFNNVSAHADRLAQRWGAPIRLRCLAEREAQELLRYSAAEERRLLPTWHVARRLRDAFTRARTEHRLCSADSHAALRDHRWQRVLEQLGTTV